ncbi:MAG TPA: thioesterase family protein [Verrucomicrobiota bacterium]|nr:thioesterase family protein [Verrucomicrobiota bacterium]
MKGRPKVGAVGEQKFVVEAKHAIDFADGGMPPVLCTPWLIWFLEHAAREAVLPCLEVGESTVGLEIEVRHVAPTPLGHIVTCAARVIHVDGARITFQVEAHDQTELIARGVHRLQVIRVAGFAKRVQQKAAPR